MVELPAEDGHGEADEAGDEDEFFGRRRAGLVGDFKAGDAMIRMGEVEERGGFVRITLSHETYLRRLDGDIHPQRFRILRVPETVRAFFIAGKSVSIPRGGDGVNR